MALQLVVRSESEQLRTLSKAEIDRRMDWIVSRVTRLEGLRSLDPDGDPLHPRWITPAELVRRMRPFLVYN